MIPRHFSLFSGVEGFGLGLDKLVETIGVSEIDKYASMVLRYRFPNAKNYGDCKEIDYAEVPDFDILTGGSPCQDFSIAGGRAGITGSKSGLVWEYVRALREKQPRYFIWENVKGCLSSGGGFDFARIITAFSESGYSLWWQVLNAKDFGVPQNRERIFIVGFRDQPPPEIYFESTGAGQIQIQGSTIGEENTRRGDRDIVYGVDSIVGALKASDYGAPTQILVTNKGVSQHCRIYDTSGLAPTLQSQSGMSSQKHPFIKNGDFVRRLMPIECERVMGLPSGWTQWGTNDKGEKVEMSDNRRYRMCGNAVVPSVIKALADYVITVNL